MSRRPESMQAVVHYALAPGACELQERPVPAIGPDDVLLQTAAVGVCGSDVHQYANSHSWPVNVPVTLGHEFAGVIVEVGANVRHFSVGERVVSETAAVIDPESPFTRSGAPHLDPGRKGFGYGVDGAMANYVRVPQRCLHRVPSGVDMVRAALTEPCCVAYQAVVKRTPMEPGDVVIVIGPGPIGLLCAQMARLRGATEVIVVGRSGDEKRLALAEEYWATRTFLGDQDDVHQALNEVGDGYGADVVIDAAGASAALKDAIEWVRPGGHVTKVGWGPQPLEYSLDPIVQKAVTIAGSFSHTWSVWERVLRLMQAGTLDPMPLVGMTASLEEWQTAFDRMHHGEIPKAVLLPNGPVSDRANTGVRAGANAGASAGANDGVNAGANDG